MKGDYMKKVKLPTQMKSKKMWCRNCGRFIYSNMVTGKNIPLCVCGKSSWSASKVL